MANINNVITSIQDNKFQRGNLFELTTCQAGSKNLLRLQALNPDGRRVYIQSASTPESLISTIEIPFQGRRVKLPGDRTFGQWTVTFLSDASHTIRTELEEWSDRAASLGETTRNIDEGMGEWILEMRNDDDGTTKIFEIFNCVPVSVGAANVSLADANNYVTFPVTLAYTHFKITTP